MVVTDDGSVRSFPVDRWAGEAVAARRLPAYVRAPAAVGPVVWGSVTLLAVPVPGRFGARDDNRTLLDRPYVVTGLVGCAVTVLLVGVAGTVRSQRGVADA